MRVVIQRVKQASVQVDAKIVSQIGPGLLVLVGISRDDTTKDLAYMARKIGNLRIFEDAASGRRWNKSVKDVNGEVLCVSQFTLHSVLKGNKLDFHLAMAPELSKTAYDNFLALLRKEFKSDNVKDGIFGAMMDVSLINDGPVTISLDSKSSNDATLSSVASSPGSFLEDAASSGDV